MNSKKSSFIDYMKDITINLSKDDDAEKFLIDNHLIDDVQDVINEINTELNLSKNKKKFNVSFSKDIPRLINRDENLLVQEWLNSNEKLCRIKKSFLTYLNDIKF